MSIRPHGKLGSYLTDFREILYLSIFNHMSRKLKYRDNLTGITGTLHENLRTFRICCWILLRMINASHKSCSENRNTNFMFNKFFFRKSRRLWDNVEKYGITRQVSDDNIKRRTRFPCWITKATDTHSEYVILIAFTWQQWLCERVSMLRYTYIACHVFLNTWKQAIKICV